MSDNTQIEWTEATWNPVTGCSVLSPGCTHCYAMKLAGTRLAHHPSRAGLTIDTKAGPVWNGQVRFNEQWLDQPLRWKRPRMIFVCAHGDLFHESVPDEWIDQVFAVMALCPQHTFQVLTKRSARMREYVNERGGHGSTPGHHIMHAMDGLTRERWPELQWPLSNVWLGVSVEDQQRANERIPDLLDTPAAVRWLSCEPLLGPVNLNRLDDPADHSFYIDPLNGEAWDDVNGGLNQEIWGQDEGPKLDWIVAGGESGPGARPMHPDWARSLRDQCAAAGVPFFFKQWGEFGPDTGPDGDVDRNGLPRDRVMEGAGPCAAWLGDRWQLADHGYAMPMDLPGDNFEWVYRLGRRRTGRLLDGVEHSGMPEAAR